MNPRILILLGIFALRYSFAQVEEPIDSTAKQMSSSSLMSGYGGNMLPQYSPLSPNAASIQKFGDYQVNLATGIPDISIPLHTITNGKLSMPITLRYHASGFKVHEHASWVGLGWALDLGASMSRNVQGLADDGPGGYLTHAISSSKDFCNNSNDYQYGIQVSANSIDAQPDIFSYSTPTRSGKFLMGFLMKIPNYPVNISWNLTSGILQSFALVDDLGTEYQFAEKETQNVTVSGLYKSYTGSWLLTAVKSPDTDDQITYTYQSGGNMLYNENTWTTSFTYNASPPGGYYTNTTLSIPTQSNMNSTITQRNPYKITYTDGEIEFIQSSNGERLDQAQSHFLKQINVYNYESSVKKLIKVIKFNYGYFTYGSTNSRLKLNSLTITDATESTSETYNFDYWTNTVAWNTSPDVYGMDYFGYYNGASNSHLITVPSYNGVAVNAGAANRETVTTYMKNAVLKKITYPTKAYTEFDYETNKYKFSGSEKYGAGLRIKSVKSVTGSKSTVKRYEYASSDGTGVGRIATNWLPTDPQQPLIQNLDYTRNPFDPPTPPDSYATRATFTQDGPNTSIYTMDAAVIYYTTVTEYFEESTDIQKNGRNVYNFDFKYDNIITAINYNLRDVRPWLRGNLLTKAVYNKDNLLVAADTLEYSEMAVDTSLKAAFVTNPYIFDNVTGTNIPCPTTYQPSKQSLLYFPVIYQTGIKLPVQKRSMKDGVHTVENTTYTSNLLINTKETLSSRTGEKISETYFYPSFFSTDPAVMAMVARNMLNIPLNTFISHSVSSVSNTINSEKRVFGLFSGSNSRGFTNNVLLKEIWTAPAGGIQQRRVNYTDYAANGKPLAYYLDDKKISVALVWGYNSSLLIAEMRNATKAEADAAMTTASITPVNMSIPAFTSTETTKIRNLQASLPYAMVSWYAHRPHVGLSGTVSPQGTLTSYTYDALLRLRSVRDNNGNITDLYRYNYATINP